MSILAIAQAGLTVGNQGLQRVSTFKNLIQFFDLYPLWKTTMKGKMCQWLKPFIYLVNWLKILRLTEISRDVEV